MKDIKQQLEETHRNLTKAGIQVCEMLCSRKFSKIRAEHAADLAEAAVIKLRNLICD